jgi:hypothetical protein
MKLSQKQIIKSKLEKEGEVNNKWCLDNGIWRLSDIVLHLRSEGMEIDTEYGTERVGKNTHYKLIRKETLF